MTGQQLIMLLFNHQVVFDSSWPHGLQHTRLCCHSSFPRVCPSSCPLNQWGHPTILSSVAPSPAFHLFQHQGLFQWVSCLHQIIIRASIKYSVHFSRVWLLETTWTAAHQASLPITNPGAYSDSCPWNQWCHPTISSSVIPFFSCLQSFPASGSFPMSQFLASGHQRIGVSASASVLPMNIRDWFPWG